MFNSYPIYLQNSIFHDDEDTKKLRGLSITERAFIWDKYKSHGNKNYNKKNMKKALFFYERALSCFKWLEIKKPLISQKKRAVDLTDFDYEDTRKLDFNEKEQERENYFVDFTDENLSLHDGEEVKLKSDQDLRNSMLLLTYLNTSVVYIKEGNFKEALESLEDARKINERNSMVYFRTAQALVCNLGASFSQLKRAKENIEKAIYLNQFEEKNESKIYIDEANFIESMLKSKRERVKKALEEISNELPKFKNEMPSTQTDFKEYDLILEIRKKYEEAYEELLEKKSLSEAETLKREIKDLKATISEMEVYTSLNLDSSEVDYKKDDFRSQINYVKALKVKEIFAKTKFNQNIFEKVIKELFQRKEELSKKMKNYSEEGVDVQLFSDAISFLKRSWDQKNTKIALQLFVIILSLFLFYYFNKDKSLFKKLFSRP